MGVKTHIDPCPEKLMTGDRNTAFKQREISSLKSCSNKETPRVTIKGGVSLGMDTLEE